MVVVTDWSDGGQLILMYVMALLQQPKFHYVFNNIKFIVSILINSSHLFAYTNNILIMYIVSIIVIKYVFNIR